jgi:PTS system fructose-specific IIC component
VIPSLMAGSAVTGGLSMAFAVTSPAPHGGIWVIGLVGKPLLFVLAILAGVAVSAACVIALKHLGRREPAVSTAVAATPAATAAAH